MTEIKNVGARIINYPKSMDFIKLFFVSKLRVDTRNKFFSHKIASNPHLTFRNKNM